MNRILTLTLAVAAGLFGGLLARYVPSAHVKPQAAHVQAQWQALTLIDAEGHVSRVVVVDSPDHKIWTNSNR